MIRSLACALLLTACGPALALDLVLPAGAKAVANRVSPLDSYLLPVGPWVGGVLPTRRVEGRIERTTWLIDGDTGTTLQLLDPLRAQIVAAGYEIVLDCKDVECGGFDFRFGTEVVPAPDMHVDIRNYRFLGALDAVGQAISVLVSRNRNAAYIQVIRSRRFDAPAPEVAEPAIQAPTPDTPTPDLIAGLMANGHVVLGDLDFGSGADTLGPGPYGSLAALAAFLADNPGIRIALVGHTDSIGALDQNIALSKRRAVAVRMRLIDSHGAAPDRIDAEGMGYLAPVASNLTAPGRLANRRVEAILLSDR